MQKRDSNAPNRIFIDAGQVERLASQFQSTWMRRPTKPVLAGLIDNSVRGEVYYQEELTMGSDRNDPVNPLA